jgi:acetyl esterase/lipase
MVMADRPDVGTASAPVTTLTLVGLSQNLANALASVPFRRPLDGPSGKLQNVGAAVTRTTLRSFMGYSASLQIEEFRSMERVLDRLCDVVLPPFVRLRHDVVTESGEVGGVPGVWVRSRGGAADATILYLHGGGYIGTSPMMYSAFVAALVDGTGAEAFVADYRLAPEFPYPAGMLDAVAAYQGLLDTGAASDRLVVAGDSGGGGLATSTVEELARRALPLPSSLVLFSPEVNLGFDGESVTANATHDVLPWNLPSAAYLHGVDPADARVSAVNADLSGFPPTFVAFGSDEMLRDQIRRLVARLEEAGVPHAAHEEHGMFHVFPILMPWASASRRVYAAVDAFIHDNLVPAEATARA